MEHLLIIKANALITHDIFIPLMFHNHLFKLPVVKYKGELNRSYKLVMPKVVTVKQMRIIELVESDIEVEQDPMGGDLNWLEPTRMEDFSK